MKIYAHGGYSAKYPENTVVSYIEALKLNPDYLEMDVTIMNGKVYFYHPHKLFNADGSHLLNEEVPDEFIFPSVLNAINSSRRSSKFYFDLKNPDVESVKQLISEYRDFGLKDSDIMLGVRTVELGKELNLLFSGEVLALSSRNDDFEEFSNLGITKYRLWDKYVTVDRVEDIHQLNLEVIVTVGEKGENKATRTAGDTTLRRLNELEELNVDGVIMNDLGLAEEMDWL